MIRSERTLWALALTFLFFLLAACGDHPTALTPYDGPDVSKPVRFSVSDVSVELQGTIGLAGLLQVASQPLLDSVEEPVWSTSDESTVLVYPDGTVRGMALGDATVTVDIDGSSASLTVLVVEPTGSKPRDDLEQER